MSDAPSFTLPPDELALHAWLDGELPPAQQEAVTLWLDEHPEEAARVRLWAADREALRVRLDPLLHEPVPVALQQAVWRTEVAGTGGVSGGGTGQAQPPGGRGWQGWRLAAGFVAGVAVALGAQQFVGQGPAASGGSAGVAAGAWPQAAAVAHAVYVPEVRHPVEVSTRTGTGADAQQEAHLAAWLTKRIGRPVRLFDFRDEGFALVGGRLLPGGTGPSAQLMYEEASGRRITVYLQAAPDEPRAGPQRPGAEPVQFRYEQQGELGLFYWVEGEPGQATGYALVGALPKDRLLALARHLDAQLASR